MLRLVYSLLDCVLGVWHTLCTTVRKFTLPAKRMGPTNREIWFKDVKTLPYTKKLGQNLEIFGLVSPQMKYYFRTKYWKLIAFQIIFLSITISNWNTHVFNQKYITFWAGPIFIARSVFHHHTKFVLKYYKCICIKCDSRVDEYVRNLIYINVDLISATHHSCRYIRMKNDFIRIKIWIKQHFLLLKT